MLICVAKEKLTFLAYPNNLILFLQYFCVGRSYSFISKKNTSVFDWRLQQKPTHVASQLFSLHSFAKSNKLLSIIIRIQKGHIHWCHFWSKQQDKQNNKKITFKTLLMVYPFQESVFWGCFFFILSLKLTIIVLLTLIILKWLICQCHVRWMNWRNTIGCINISALNAFAYWLSDETNQINAHPLQDFLDLLFGWPSTGCGDPLLAEHIGSTTTTKRNQNEKK